ncbi:protealysin inhibitor emfourin [Motilibacter deserti]|uniref:Uncharacterized protein n=1 Tax=Motilibacter deserti TaxID=2714956 RepID=A0ABX0GPQ7_9ACTN|nr:protealysin inhibitor emfourin [Motilibacter deserti]NHC12821.1 hypothetical protein [Motilibacter deserti]
MTEHPGSGGPAAGPGVRVVVRRTGGFAGVARVWTLAEADLGPEEAGRLRALADEAASAQVLPGDRAPGRTADGFEIEVVLERGGARETVRAAEHDAPVPVRALLDLARASGTRGDPFDAGGARPG